MRQSELIEQAKALRKAPSHILKEPIEALPCQLRIKECCNRGGGEIVYSTERELKIGAAACPQCRRRIVNMRALPGQRLEADMRVLVGIGRTWLALYEGGWDVSHSNR